MPRRKSTRSGNASPPPLERASRARQRQRLIEACISALHIHGPSHTTVEKVVALADMSPGIVRFYFESKDAMLLASLAYLAQEFETRVMLPVAGLRDTPVRALETLVELYLDADIASSRKVSVWYSFWGEASSRQEYLEICGQKDDDFAALVLDLIERTIGLSGALHLDADAIALGLIGVLEVLWQGIAFTTEKDIDRAGAKRRSLAYLRSVFPRQFAPAESRRRAASVPSERWYTDASLLVREREQLFRSAWQIVGHESDLPRAGDFLAVDLPGERALIVRDDERRIHAFRNLCRRRPHALVSEPRGHFPGEIECRFHGLSWGLDGEARRGADMAAVNSALAPLALEHPGRFLLVRAPGTGIDEPPPAGEWNLPESLQPAEVQLVAVAANWKLLVEQWFDAPAQRDPSTFLHPNQLLQLGRERALILQVLPDGPQRCHLRVLSYVRKEPGASRRAPATGTLPAWIRQDIEVAESMQKGLAAGAIEVAEAVPPSEELLRFRSAIAALLSNTAEPAR
ncbi:MAG: TetR family transcriptional regulator C-terminal domain-containing protein [Sinobacteraceae bacterium]|nr:TetR family transcriptional regulator C-terminal domain-containing protein [Nevskiaceae bacterium]